MTVAASNGYVTATTSPLTFTPGSWSDAQTVTINGVDDNIQVAESYTATISHTASSSDPLFDGEAVFYFPGSEVCRIAIQIVGSGANWLYFAKGKDFIEHRTTRDEGLKGVVTSVPPDKGPSLLSFEVVTVSY